MEAAEMIKERRSIRQYKDTAVSHEVLEEVVALAAYAPSWKNTQITRYIAVEDTAKIAKIAAECVPEHNAKIISKAPMLIVVTGIQKRAGYERDGSFTTAKEDRWQNFDCGIATQTFCLAAHEKGLGTVIMGIFDENKVKDIITIPENQEIMALVAIGYPDEEPPAPKRKTVEDLLSYC